MAIITVQKLNDADRDADSLDDFVSGNGKKKVTTRKGIEYLTAPEVEQTLLDNGLQRGFPNLAALQAHRPAVVGSLAKDMSNRKVWMWNGSGWLDTGKSDLDLAKGFTESFFDRGIVGANLDLKTITVVGEYTLQSSLTYIGMPDEAKGKGCQLEVSNAVGGIAGYVIQKVTIHSESNKFWTRRVQKQPIPANNVEGPWFYSLDSINPKIISDLKEYSNVKSGDVLSKSMHYKGNIDDGIDIKTITEIGLCTLLTSLTYIGLPDEAKGKGCQLEVSNATGGIAGYVIQKVTIHSESNKFWTRRVQKQPIPANNVEGPWFYSLDKQGGNTPDFSKLPTTERYLKNGDVWNDNSIVTVRSNWGDLYTKPTTEIIGDLTKLYAFYDALVAEFPHYITREMLGVDEWDLPIYQYTFSPPKRRMYEYSASVGKRPKILLTSGTHGGERGAQMGVIIFIDNLCRHWKELDIYDELRWNTDFVVIPATIPSSVQDATRKNRNGVDCNRNFDWKWGEGSNPSPDPNSPMYQGPYAASEIDVQVLQREILARHSDALLLLENHNHNNPQAFWVGSNSPSVMYIGLEAADKVTPYVFKEIVPNADQAKTTQFVTRNYEGSFAGYMESKGIPAILIETSGDLVFDQNDGTVTSLRRLHELLILNIVESTVKKEMRKRFESWPLV